MRPIYNVSMKSASSNGYSNGNSDGEEIQRPHLRQPLDPEEHDEEDYYEDEEGNDEEEEYYEQQQEQQQQPTYSKRHPDYDWSQNDDRRRHHHVIDAPEGMEDEEAEYVDMGYPLGEGRPGMQDEEPDRSEASAVGVDDAILDLAELEQLQEEAERMKALGNKHMAAQEYTRAYNAYSAALQLSPVGPSSHVFLSNRAASLLSLKRYSAAAVDARRAVALAPTFGKAHARLGQALYFLKQYKGAVEAYEDALTFEEEGGSNSDVTHAYLQKAREKLARQEEKERKKQNAVIAVDDGHTVGEESALQTVAYSVVTDKKGVGLASGLHSSSERVNAVAKISTEGDQPALQNIDEINAHHYTLSPPETQIHNSERLNGRSSPTLLTIETGPMGGPAQRRVEPPQDRTLGRIQNVALARATNNEDDNASNSADEPDPDFDEALRLQRRATHFLSHKHYKLAVDEFSAALFLVPDDPVLSPQLHVGRAHALNGQERFESAKNDALMALRHILRNGVEDVSAAEAYSVLGKTLYYSKDYQGAMEALEECERIWKINGGKLSVFDEAYLEQCIEALDAGLGIDQSDGMSVGGGLSVVSTGVKSVVSTLKEGRPLTNIPKLKPPRFVSREAALQSTPNIPPMPKSWPQQSPTSPSSIATGPERTVIFLSDAMGIKLNRGNDGFVRVMSVADLPPGSPILRKGKIITGDLVREAGGVDLRRPITATMWGDTVALIKMAPRPISIIVASEITTDSVNSSKTFDFPSAVIGDESVAVFMSEISNEIKEVGGDTAAFRSTKYAPTVCLGAKQDDEPIKTASIFHIEKGKEDQNTDKQQEVSGIGRIGRVVSTSCQENGVEVVSGFTVLTESLQSSNTEKQNNCTITKTSTNSNEFESHQGHCELGTVDDDDLLKIVSESAQKNSINSREFPELENDINNVGMTASSINDDHIHSQSDKHQDFDFSESLPEADSTEVKSTSRHDMKSLINDREILFDDSLIGFKLFGDETQQEKRKIQGWANQQWIAKKPKLSFSGHISRVVEEKKFFWLTESFQIRILAIYSNPDLILILRLPTDLGEIQRLLPINVSDSTSSEEMTSLLNCFLVAESVIDPKTCKLRLSQLTTTTSIPVKKNHSASKANDCMKRSCFELITPTESISLSVAALSHLSKANDNNYSNSHAILETTKFEDAISETLFTSHFLLDEHDIDASQEGHHQIVLGTLHSYVISGNDKSLEDSLESALHFKKLQERDQYEDAVIKLDSSVIDSRDKCWKTALHYACEKQRNSAVKLLINAGASCMIPNIEGKTPLHLCAERLDEKSLSILLSTTHPMRPDPNALDCQGRTPMHLAAVEGHGVEGINDVIALSRCLSALNAWGGQLTPVKLTLDSKNPLHPVHYLSAKWEFERLPVALSYSNYCCPTTNPDIANDSCSALFGYPIHTALICLREQIILAFHVSKDTSLYSRFNETEPKLVQTLQTLLQHGFEPNERVKGIVGEGHYVQCLNEFFGFTPVQILAHAAKEVRFIDIKKQEIGDDGIETMKLVKNILETIQLAVEVLLRNGARTNLPPPPSMHLNRDTPKDCYSLNNVINCQMPPVDREGLKIDGDNNMITLLGGMNRLKASKKIFETMSKVEYVNQSDTYQSRMTFKLADATDSKSCAICWNEFGLISNRKQVCFISKRCICNDCSTKRLVIDGTDCRISDGQFLLAKMKDSKQTKGSQSKSQIVPSKGKNCEGKGQWSLGLKNIGHSSNARINKVKTDLTANDTVSTTISHLHETRNAVIERGDKLQNLADKTEALNQASLDFANLAKELNRKQSSFW